MALAELIGNERRDVAMVGNSASISGSSWFRSNESSVLDDGELVLNAAVSLCAAAAKKVCNYNCCM